MKWLLFIITAALPSYLIRFQIGKLPSTILEVLILFTFVVWLVGKLSTGELRAYFKNFPRLWFLIICLWLAATTISVLVSPNTHAALGIWKAYFVEPILFLFVFVDVIKTRRDLNLIFTGLGVSAIYIGVFAILQRFFGFPIPAPWQSELRVTSIFEYPNAVGLFLGPLIPLFVGLAIDQKYSLSPSKGLKIFFLLTTLFAIISIVLAKSEGAILGVVAGLFILGFLWSKRTRLTTPTLFILILIILISVPITRTYLIEKATLRDWSGLVRRITWDETWNMLRDRPILGAGLAGYQTAMIPYHKNTAIEIFLYPHNVFLNFWSELGLFGLLVFLAIIFFLFFGRSETSTKLLVEAKLRPKNKAKIYLLAAATTLFVHGLVDVPYFKNDLSILFWLIIAAAIVLGRSETSTKIPS